MQQFSFKKKNEYKFHFTYFYYGHPTVRIDMIRRTLLYLQTVSLFILWISAYPSFLYLFVILVCIQLLDVDNLTLYSRILKIYDKI